MNYEIRQRMKHELGELLLSFPLWLLSEAPLATLKSPVEWWPSTCKMIFPLCAFDLLKEIDRVFGKQGLFHKLPKTSTKRRPEFSQEEYINRARNATVEQVLLILDCFLLCGCRVEVDKTFDSVVPFTNYLFLLNLLDKGESYLKWKTVSIFSLTAAKCSSRSYKHRKVPELPLDSEIGKKHSFLKDLNFDSIPFELVEVPSFVHTEDKSWVLFGGQYYSFLRNIIRGGNRHSAYNFLMVKYGMPSVSEFLIEESRKKTFRNLTTCREHPTWSEDLLWGPETSSPVPLEHVDIKVLSEVVRQVVSKIFPRGWSDSQKWQKPLLPSVSGHYQYGCNRLGAMGKLVKVKEIFNDPFFHSFNDEFITFDGLDDIEVTKNYPKADLPFPTINLAAEMDLARLIRKRDEIEERKNLLSVLPINYMLLDFSDYEKLWEQITPNVEDHSHVGFEDIGGILPRGRLIDDSDLESISEFRVCLPPRKHNFEKMSQRIAIESRFERELQTKTVGLPEPFKVRVITGGPEAKYFQARYIQKLVHGHLRGIPGFELIGEPLTSDYLDKVLRLPLDDQFYVSGDYSAATDNLNPLLSEVAARVISQNAGWHREVEDLFVDCLVNHMINDPDLDDPCPTARADGSEKQAWGQLMGSPVSFPILCLVNYALAAYALDLRKRGTISFQPRQLGKVGTHGICVNGDDIAFVTDRLGYRMWKQVMTAGGLSPSLGKNFCSNQFVIINSQMFDATYQNDFWTEFVDYRVFDPVPFVNFGLCVPRETHVEGQILGKSGSPKIVLPDVGELARAFLHGHEVESQRTLIRYFLARWKDVLVDICPPGMSWFLPRHLGGLGIPLIGEHSTHPDGKHISFLQRKMAHYLDAKYTNQHRLKGMTIVGRTKNASMYARALSALRKSVPDLIEYRRSDDTNELPVMSDILARVLEQMDATDVQAMVDGDRHQKSDMYKSFREIWRHVRTRTTYSPLTDPEIYRSVPWKESLNPLYTIEDDNIRVSLQEPLASNCAARCRSDLNAIPFKSMSSLGFDLD